MMEEAKKEEAWLKRRGKKISNPVWKERGVSVRRIDLHKITPQSLKDGFVYDETHIPISLAWVQGNNLEYLEPIVHLSAGLNSLLMENTVLCDQISYYEHRFSQEIKFANNLSELLNDQSYEKGSTKISLGKMLRAKVLKEFSLESIDSLNRTRRILNESMPYDCVVNYRFYPGLVDRVLSAFMHYNRSILYKLCIIVERLEQFHATASLDFHKSELLTQKPCVEERKPPIKEPLLFIRKQPPVDAPVPSASETAS